MQGSVAVRSQRHYGIKMFKLTKMLCYGQLLTNYVCCPGKGCKIQMSTADGMFHKSMGFILHVHLIKSPEAISSLRT